MSSELVSLTDSLLESLESSIFECGYPTTALIYVDNKETENNLVKYLEKVLKPAIIIDASSDVIGSNLKPETLERMEAMLKNAEKCEGHDVHKRSFAIFKGTDSVPLSLDVLGRLISEGGYSTMEEFLDNKGLSTITVTSGFPVDALENNDVERLQSLWLGRTYESVDLLNKMHEGSRIITPEAIFARIAQRQYALSSPNEVVMESLATLSSHSGLFDENNILSYAVLGGIFIAVVLLISFLRKLWKRKGEKPIPEKPRGKSSVKKPVRAKSSSHSSDADNDENEEDNESKSSRSRRKLKKSKVITDSEESVEEEPPVQSPLPLRHRQSVKL